MLRSLNQKGALHLLLLLTGVGVLIIYLILTLAPFKNNLFSSLFPKQLSFAAENLIVNDLILEPTFNSIDVELPFADGSSETLTEAKLEFKKSSDSNWREGLPLSPLRPVDISQPQQPIAVGAVLLADAGTSYDVRVTAKSSTGASKVVSGSTTTRAENIPAASSITATHYVNAATGDDSRTEEVARNKATPWKTLSRAVAASSVEAAVEFAPGFYAEISNKGSSVNTIVSKKLTLKAEFPAVDDNLNPINIGKHSVIQDGRATGTGASMVVTPYTTGPIGSGVSFENAWVQDGTLSAAAGKPIWKWAGSSHAIGSATPYHMGFHQTKDSQPIRIMHWSRLTDSNGSANTMTPASWASTLGNNKTYRFGFYQDAVAPYDIYLAPPANMVDTNGAATADPNKTFITVGEGYGLLLRAADIRITGFELRNFENCIVIGGTSSNSTTYNNAIIDHNIFNGCLAGIRMDSTSTPNSGHGLGSKNAVVQYNLFSDRTLWTDNHATDPGSPWVFTKEKITRADGSLSAGNRFGGNNESIGITFKNEGAKWVVVRNNKFDGPQNGMGANGGVVGAPRDATRGVDFYNNECYRIIDDCTEPENASINWKIWNNKIHKTTVILSAAPIHWGPLFFFRNQAWDIGAVGGGVEHSSGRTRLSTAVLMKGGALNPAKFHVRPILYFINNTYWTNVAGGGIPNNSDYGSGGIDDTINGQGNYNMAKYLRNNIIRTTRYVSRIGQVDFNTNWNEDYNAMASRNSPEQSTNNAYVGMRIEGGISGRQMYSSYDVSARQVSGNAGYTIEDYRSDLAATPNRPANYGNGINTNKYGPGKTDVAFASPVEGSGAVAILDALLVDPSSGNLTLKTGTNPLIDGGVSVPNISDCYAGSAPDIGAIESGASANCTTSTQPSSPSPAPAKPGDIDNNGKVDIFDYNQLLTDFGKTGPNLLSDIEKTGTSLNKVDIFDLNLLLSNFGS